MVLDVGGPVVTSPVPPADTSLDLYLPRFTARLNRPIPRWACILSWFVATGLFVGVIALFGGPTSGDGSESFYGTWAIEHGNVACAFPAANVAPTNRAAPLYPLLSGGVAALTRIGHATPFPSAAALGSGCVHVERAIGSWSVRAGAITPTTWIGCLCWLALMAGMVAWLRAAGRGRSGWEPLALVVAALLPAVWMSVQTVFHPQDMLALGLALVGVACARRDRWLLAGVFCALAILSQQFALLVAAPLFIVAPARRKATFAGSAVIAGALVALPLAAMTSGHVLHEIALGTGNVPSPGGTLAWYSHAAGAGAVLLYRVTPLAASVALAWWVMRRLGSRALESAPLLSLVAVSLGLRLVFEVNFFPYYVVALAICLLLLDATCGIIRRSVVAWLGALTLLVCRGFGRAFGAVSWGAALQNHVIPFVIGALALAAILLQLRTKRDRRSLLPWIGLALFDLLLLSPNPTLSPERAVWLWQVIIVGPGIVLAAMPLWTVMRNGSPGPRDLEPVSPGPT